MDKFVVLRGGGDWEGDAGLEDGRQSPWSVGDRLARKLVCSGWSGFELSCSDDGPTVLVLFRTG